VLFGAPWSKQQQPLVTPPAARQGGQLSHRVFQLPGLGVELFGGAGALLGIGRHLLGDTVHFLHGLIDLLHSQGLFIGGRGDLRHQLLDFDGAVRPIDVVVQALIECEQ